jgi:uncharacterized protein (TIGR01777 family)
MDLKPKIVIAGGSGFFGKHLIEFYKNSKQVIVLTRSHSENRDGIEYVNWNGKTLGDWSKKLDGIETLINLSGKSIDCRFTKKNKEELLNSRITTTKVLAKAISTLKTPPKVWLNASSGAMYEVKNVPNIESNVNFNTTFLSEMSLTWESAFFQLDLPKTRRVTLRISLILGSDGGIFPVLKNITKLGMGGKAGSGKQKVSWIHADDAVNAVDFIIKNGSIKGFVNFSTTGIISNAILMKAFRERFNVPIGIPTPEFMLRISTFFLRKEPDLILNSVNFIPKNLIDNGFQFKFADIDDALADLK